MTSTQIVCNFDVVRELITCGVCGEIFNDPRILPCGHTFCKECIESILSRQAHQMLCTVCHKSHELDNVENVSKNLSILQLMKVHRVEISNNMTCALCNKCPSITTCLHCKKLSCVRCIEKHKVEIAQDTIEETNGLLLETKKIKQLIKQSLDNFKCSYCKAAENAKTRVVFLFNNLYEKADELRRKINTFINEKEEVVKLRTDKITDELLLIEQFASGILKNLNGNPEVTIETLLLLKRKMEIPKEQTLSIRNEIDLGLPEVSFSASSFELKENLIGEFVIEHTTSKGHNHHQQHRSELLTVIGGNGHDKLQFAGPVSLTLNWDGHLIVTEKLNQRIQIITTDGTHVKTIAGFKDPKDTFCHELHRFYFITDTHKLIVLDSCFQKVGIIGSSTAGKKSNMFDTPTGVCGDDECVYVCDTLNDRIVSILSSTLEWKTEFYFNAGFQPKYIACNAEFLAVTSEIEKKIYLLNKNGRIIRSFPEPESSMSLQEPRALCMDDKRIHIANASSNQSIMVFTLDGERTHVIKHDYMSSPSGLVVDGDLVYVTDLDHDALLKMII